MSNFNPEAFTLKYLDDLHLIVDRMAINSRTMKQLSFAIFSGVAALSSSIDPSLGAMVIIPLFGLWFLNAHYLSIERNCIKKYDDTTAIIKEIFKENEEMSPDLLEKLYSFPKSKEHSYPSTVQSCFFTKSMWPIYLSQILIAFYVFDGWEFYGNLIKSLFSIFQ